MLKTIFLSIAAAAFIFGGAVSLQSTPAQATFWGKDRGYDRGYQTQSYGGGWMSRWHQKWAEKKARKRAWWGHRKQAVVTAPAPAPRYRPMK